MNQKIIEKLYNVAERWHIGASELMERHEQETGREIDDAVREKDLEKTARKIVKEYQARLKELLKKEQERPLSMAEYTERVILANNYSKERKK